MNASVILFDFDGVILDSMPVREKGFELIFAEYPVEQVSLLMDFHRENGGLSRYVKIRYFYEKILAKSIEYEEVNKLASKFSELMKRELTNFNLLVLDTVNFIKANSGKYRMHIVSGSDQEELRFLCNELKISQYFITIEGSPTSKIELVKNILSSHNYPHDKTVLIGDSKNDKEAAEANSILFIGYNNLSLKASGKYYIDEFSSQKVIQNL